MQTHVCSEGDVIWQFTFAYWSIKTSRSSHLARWALTKASSCFKNEAKTGKPSLLQEPGEKTDAIIKSVIKKGRGRGGENRHKANFYSRWSGSLQGFPLVMSYQVHPCCWPLTAPATVSGSTGGCEHCSSTRLWHSSCRGCQWGCQPQITPFPVKTGKKVLDHQDFTEPTAPQKYMLTCTYPYLLAHFISFSEFLGWHSGCLETKFLQSCWPLL